MLAAQEDHHVNVGGLFLNFDRMKALRALVVAYSGRFSISILSLDSALHDWLVVRLDTSSGDAVGAVAVRDGEGHIGVLPEHRAKWGGCRTLRALCDFFGVTRTTVCRDNPRSMKLLERYGWTRVGDSPAGVTYAL